MLFRYIMPLLSNSLNSNNNLKPGFEIFENSRNVIHIFSIENVISHL